MDTEDGVIWVYGVGDDGMMAFTDFGIENLINLIKIHKDDPHCSSLLRRCEDDDGSQFTPTHEVEAWQGVGFMAERMACRHHSVPWPAAYTAGAYPLG